jgi:ribosomal protein S18 acetylase RimI-like enzyme
MNRPNDEPLVRALRETDLEAVTALDARITGRRRDEYFRRKLAHALADTGIQLSLAALLDRTFAGFLLARVDYGEFGTTEPVAVLDTLGVHPDCAGRGAGSALLRQLLVNLQGLGIRRLETEVAWEDQELLSFFHRAGFRPAPRYCLDLDVEPALRLDEERAARREPAIR